MSASKQVGPLRAPGTGERITRNELFDVLADEGYSADDRKAWLRQVLTVLTGPDRDRTNTLQETLVDEIREILDDQVPGKPKADDSL